jgi:hypothetical protein
MKKYILSLTLLAVTTVFSAHAQTTMTATIPIICSNIDCSKIYVTSDLPNPTSPPPGAAMNLSGKNSNGANLIFQLVPYGNGYFVYVGNVTIYPNANRKFYCETTIEVDYNIYHNNNTYEYQLSPFANPGCSYSKATNQILIQGTSK